MKEQEFICWYEGQKEGDGKDLKAPSVQAAAKKAADIWRHENLQEPMKTTVYVKNQETGKTEKVIVAPSGEERFPEVHR